MSNRKLKIHNTDKDNLVSNLRCEIGEIITSWLLMKSLMVQANNLRSDDFEKDIENQHLVFLDILIEKLSDEIVARLSELAENKVGRLNFYFAQEKLNDFHEEVKDFTRYIKKNDFHKKRNYDISHKELPEQWSDHKILHIPYSILIVGIVKAIRLMKLIDSVVLGPRSKYLWREMRRRRYQLKMPAKIEYLLLPYFWLSADERFKIIMEEMEKGIDNWVYMPIKINGVEKNIKTYGELGALMIDKNISLFPEPFVEINSINFPSKQDVVEKNYNPESKDN